MIVTVSRAADDALDALLNQHRQFGEFWTTEEASAWQAAFCSVYDAILALDPAAVLPWLEPYEGRRLGMAVKYPKRWR